ncbi:MAG: hypothetical protein KIS81_09580 [Maricaulaceae bacterium]|nr:hypothetical protein [Maricaulaceae bacterium]
MTPLQALAVTLIRFYVLVLAFNAVYILSIYIPLALIDTQNSPSVTDAIVHSISMFGHLTLSILFWFAAPRLARWVMPRTQGAEFKINISGDQILMIGMSLIGLYFFVSGATAAIPDIIAAIENARQAHTDASPTPIRSRPAYVTVQMLTGLILFLGAFRLGPVFRWLRNAGLSKIASPKSDDPS